MSIAVLPLYADQVSDVNILELYEVQVPEPPIFQQIITCLSRKGAEYYGGEDLCVV